MNAVAVCCEQRLRIRRMIEAEITLNGTATELLWTMYDSSVLNVTAAYGGLAASQAIAAAKAPGARPS